MDSIEELLTLLNAGQVIERISISTDQEIELILDSREREDFSSQWMESFDNVESQKSSMENRLAESVAQIRKVAYLKSYARWKSPDLAAYISDDFGLIADAIAMRIKDPWLELLLNSYWNGAIPTNAE
jgi:hypothetical protein